MDLLFKTYGWVKYSERYVPCNSGTCNVMSRTSYTGTGGGSGGRAISSYTQDIETGVSCGEVVYVNTNDKSQFFSIMRDPNTGVLIVSHPLKNSGYNYTTKLYSQENSFSYVMDKLHYLSV